MKIVCHVKQGHGAENFGDHCTSWCMNYRCIATPCLFYSCVLVQLLKLLFKNRNELLIDGQLSVLHQRSARLSNPNPILDTDRLVVGPPTAVNLEH